MKMRTDFRNIVGFLMLGAFLAGCFAPIVYGVYKVYEDKTHIKVTLNVKEKPEVVYAKALDVIKQREQKGLVTITKKDDKKMEVEGTREGVPASMKVTPLKGGESSTLTVVEEKGKTPEEQAKGLEKYILDTCANIGLTCTKGEK